MGGGGGCCCGEYVCGRGGAAGVRGGAAGVRVWEGALLE